MSEHGSSSRRRRGASGSMGSSSRKKKNLRNAKSFGSNRARLGLAASTKSSLASQAPSPVLGLGEMIDAFHRFDMTDLWRMATSCVEETVQIAEQLAEPSQLIMNADVQNICDALNGKILLTDDPSRTSGNWVPNEVVYVEGEDDVSTELTWSGSYMVEHAREILRREAERRERRRQARARREKRANEKNDSRDVLPPPPPPPPRDQLALLDSTSKSSTNTEISTQRVPISKKGADDTTRSRRSVFKSNGEDTTRSLRRSIFNGVKTVQNKSAEFLQKRRQRRKDRKRSGPVVSKGIPVANQ